jgi:phosphate starvation-inducible PhoH-like protein
MDFLFQPLNDQQRQAQKLWQANDILILLGQAGSGKTHVALGLAATEVLSKRSQRVVLSRPVVPAGGEQLGFLPGKLEQKMHPWLLPIHDCLRRMTFVKPEEWIKTHCEICPLAYMRGRTFDRSVAILDEAQNATYEMLTLFLTRIGPKGKLILSGDPYQTDLEGSGFREIVQRLQDLPGVAIVSLTTEANPRHPIIPKLLQVL